MTAIGMSASGASFPAHHSGATWTMPRAIPSGALPSPSSSAYIAHALAPRWKVITKTEDAGFNKTRTIAAGLGTDGGDRILRCVGSPACVAKNRYGLPAELPLSWQALVSAMVSNNQSKEN